MREKAQWLDKINVHQWDANGMPVLNLAVAIKATLESNNVPFVRGAPGARGGPEHHKWAKNLRTWYSQREKIRTKDGPQYIVALTDGADCHSKQSDTTARNKLANAGVTLLIVGLSVSGKVKLLRLPLLLLLLLLFMLVLTVAFASSSSAHQVKTICESLASASPDGMYIDAASNAGKGRCQHSRAPDTHTHTVIARCSMHRRCTH